MASCCRRGSEPLKDAGSTPTQGCFQRIKNFLFGPELAIILEEKDRKDLPNGPFAPVEMEIEVPDLGHDDEGTAAVRGDATLGEVNVQLSLKDGAQEGAKSKQELPTKKKQVMHYYCSGPGMPEPKYLAMASFNTKKQVYTSIGELSLLPFAPPPFLSFVLQQLGGTFKVVQYVVTVMVALMAMQHSVERYWSMQGDTSLWQDLLFCLFISYPMITLMLVVLTNNETAIRRFMYYRMMSLQVIIDWANRPMWTLWFFAYFTASFVLLLVYGLWAGWLTQDDMTVSVWPQLSIVAMQSMLLFMFWMTAVNMEEQLVPLNKVIEREPDAAKDLISKCKVVVESNFKLAILGAYQRKKAFKRLPVDLSGHQAALPRTRMLVERDSEGEKVLRQELITHQGSQNSHGEDVHGANSLAAWFDLNTMRARGNDEQTVVYNNWLSRMYASIYDMTYGRIFAVVFATSFWSLSLFRLGSGLTSMAIFAIEAYAIWFVVFAKSDSDKDVYGITECKLCYDYQQLAGATCTQRPQTDVCWGAAKRGYCTMLDALLFNFKLNDTDVAALNSTSCLAQKLVSGRVG